MKTGNAGRSGRKWRQLKARVRREESLCWICAKLIDKALDFPHPDSFSVDHKQPRHLHPHLAEVRTNLAAAHLKCNRSKGVGAAPEIGPDPSRDW